MDALRWGLIPNWAKDPKNGYKTINARVETVDTARSYREAFKKRRCLIPADSFYEWKKVLGGKIPFSIGMKDDAPFVFAGLWVPGSAKAWHFLRPASITIVIIGISRLRKWSFPQENQFRIRIRPLS